MQSTLLGAGYPSPKSLIFSIVVGIYSKRPKVGNPQASILKNNVWGIPALFDLNPVSNFMGFTL